MQFLYEFRNVFTAHFLSDVFAKQRGTKQSFQRFETCIQSLESHSFDFALEALLAKTYFSETTQNVVREFVSDAVKDYWNGIEAYKVDDKHAHVKRELLQKLENVQLAVMFQDEVLNDTIIDGIYEDFNGNETMSFFEMKIAVSSFNRKLQSVKKSNWISTIRPTKIKYLFDENILGKFGLEIF